MRGINFNNWKIHSDILTDSLWMFDERDSDEKLDFHGAFIPQVAYQLISRYTAQGDTVVDLFIGSGTTFKVASRLKRLCIGVDIQPYNKPLPEGCYFIQGDSCNYFQTKAAIKEYMDVDLVNMIICHPPYHDIIQFTEDPRDLSNVNHNQFLDCIQRLSILVHDLLEPKGIAALVIGDKYEKGHLVPLGFECMQEFSKLLTLKGIVVKNIENNEAKGKNKNLWRYRALKGGFFEFKHEYIMLFQK